MGEMVENASRIAVGIARDRLAAWIDLRDRDDPRPVSGEEVAAALAEASVVVDEKVQSRIDTYVTMLAAGQDVPVQYVIAEGKSAREGRDGDFLWNETLKGGPQDGGDDGAIDYYSLNSTVTVDEGQTFGTILLATPGVDGVDVCGARIPPKKRPVDIKLASTVSLGPDEPLAAIANVAGKVTYEQGALSIDEVVQIDHDIDFESGNVDSVVDVKINGTVSDLFSVKSKKSVSVSGAIEAANVVAGESVVVRGGILGRDKGTVTADGEIVARFCEKADLRAGGDIMVAREVINSRVRTEGKLIVIRGAVIGGDVYARLGAEIGTLGSAADVPTTLTVGIDPASIQEVEAIKETLESKRRLASRIYRGVEPLMAKRQQLDPLLWARVEKLFAKAKAFDAEVAETERNCDSLLENVESTGNPYVLIGKIVHAGVVVRIGRWHVRFDKALKGPIRIEKREIKHATEVVAVNQLSGSVAVLHSFRV